MIVTLTMNPSLDFLYEADDLVWDDANRVAAPRRRPGGQGINAARATRALGRPAIAVAPLGGPTGTEIRTRLEAEGLDIRSIEIEQETRVFTGVRVRARAGNLLLNPRGPRVTAAEEEEVRRVLTAALREAGSGWLACCGSLPPDTRLDFYADVLHVARELGFRTICDCDTPALSHAARFCDVLVPNEHEAARLLGREAAAEPAHAARELLAFGCHTVAITLGARGAVLATRDGTWQAEPPAVDGSSAVGAGDAFLAALLVGLDDGAAPDEILRFATAAGSAVLLSGNDQLLDAADAMRLACDVKVARVA